MNTVEKQEYDNLVKSIRRSKSAIETGEFAGIEKGIEKAKINAVLTEFKNELSISQISKLNDLSEEEVIKILKNHGNKLGKNYFSEEYYAYANSIGISRSALNSARLVGYYEGLELAAEEKRVKFVLRGHDNNLSASQISDIFDFSEEKVIKILKDQGRMK